MTAEPTPERPWVITDWTGRRVCPDETFETFTDARDRISELANAEADAGPAADAEDTYNGVCEDLYAETPYTESENR